MLKSLTFIHLPNKGLKLILFYLVFGIATIPKSQAQDPFIPKFDAVKQSEKCFSITPEANNQFGAAWLTDKIDFSKDTVFNFVVYMGSTDGTGGNGLDFVMHKDPLDTGVNSTAKIIPSVTIEIDTWNNSDVQDGLAGTDANGVVHVTSPYYGMDHTAVVYNGDKSGGLQQISTDGVNFDRILPLKPAAIFPVSQDIEDDACYTFQVKWDVQADGTQNLELWIDTYDGTSNTGGLQMIMRHNDDMINNVFGGDASDVWFGFTGSTEAVTSNEQTICLLEDNPEPVAQDDAVSIPLNSTVEIDIESNDNDPNGDQLYVTGIAIPANHGVATIIDSLNVNYIQYTPNISYVGLDTIAYVTCDANSTKCYSKCDTAYVYINVGCIPFDVSATQLSSNSVCSDTVPPNGAASANVDATYLRGTFYYEGFEDVPSGATSDAGASGWTSTTVGACKPGNQIHVDTYLGGQKFRVEKAQCQVDWMTTVMDISAVSDVAVTVDFEAVKTDGDDFIEVYYILDGGPEVPFNNGILSGDFGVTAANINGLNGNTLQIVIHARNDGGEENYYWDNIHVTAVGAGVPDVTYQWYDDTGANIYNGQVSTGMDDGTYTVVAIDNATGCPSNPTNVTIDSTGYNVSGGFIEQVAPFTNCKLPYDGALAVGVIVGPDTLTAGYQFDWYYQEDPKTPFFQQGTGPAFANLEGREYSVVITELSSGCDTTMNKEVINGVMIPTVTATKLADVISCSDPNTGSGEANVAGDTSAFNFEWYIGPGIGAAPPDFTSSTVNTFLPGIYTVQAIDTATACASESRSITISDLSVLPDVLVTVVSEQISCDTLRPTGEFSGAVNEAGVSTTAGYTFNWYKGPNDIIPARNGYAGGTDVDSLAAGIYRLVVVQDFTNCTSFVDTLIQDMTVAPPDVTLTTVDVSSCAVPNGSITVNVVGNPADYTYELYTGFGVISDSLLQTTASNVISNLPIGNYTVVAKDVITKCATNPTTTTIVDATVLPAASFTSGDQVSCDPANPTGQLTAAVGIGLISDYTFEWFESDTLGASIVPSSADGEVISVLDTGTYALRITSNVSQCVNVLYSAVNLGIVLPVEVVSAVPSTNCGIAANGQLVATVDGGRTELNGYTFIWESVTNADTLAATTATVTALEPGDYILTVLNDSTTCVSNPAPVTIADNTVIPDPALNVSDNSSCDVINPNGEIQVAGINNEANPVSDYNFIWYDGNSSGPQLLSPAVSYPNDPDSSLIGGLSADTLALVITNSITTCSNEVLSIIYDINIKPIIDAVTVDGADHCADPYMSGANIVTVDGGAPVPADYTFGWTNLDGGPVIAGNSSSIADIDLADEILPPGNYQLIAYNAFNCPSDPYPFTLADNAVPPTFSVSGFDNISCDVSLPVGSVVASKPDGSYAISSFEWFENNTSGALLATTTTNDSILYNLDAGTYAVRITDALTGCTDVEYASLQDIPSNNPIILNIRNDGLTSCSSPDGEMAFQVVPFETEPPLHIGPRNYTFYINGATAYNQSSAGTDSATFINLTVGNWDAWVVDDFTHCQSSPIAVTMADAPEINIIADAVKLPTSCAAVDGELDIYAETMTNNTLSGGAGFVFDWFRGADGTQGAVSFTTAADNFSSSAVGISSDYYYVAIVDLETGCSDDTAVFVPNVTLPDFLNELMWDSDRCAPFGNGGVSAELANFTDTLDYEDYDFLVFEGPTFNTAWPADNTGLINAVFSPAGGPVTVDNALDPGTYTLVVKENFGNCFSDPIVFEVDLNFTFPELTITTVADKSCAGAPSGTGQLEVVSTSTGMPLPDFNFDWYIGASLEATGAQTPATLFASNYTVIGDVIANVPGQGCIMDSLIALPKVLDQITIVENVTPNNNCAPFDGSIQFANIQENGVGIGLPGNYVNFNIFDTNLAAISPSTGDGVVIPWGELAPGNYYLQAQNDVTKCMTEILQVTVDELAQNPVINIVANSSDYGCNFGAANGELEAFATAGSQNIAEYDFAWYQGLVGGLVVSDPIDPYMALNLTANNSSQLYTIEIEDIAGANLGCVASRQYTLLHQQTTVSLLSTQMTIDPQTNCGPNGSVSINQINEDDGSIVNTMIPDYSGIYQAQLLDANLNVIDPIASTYAAFSPVNGTFGANDVPAGTYYAQAANISNGCAYGPLVQVIVLDESIDPVISAILDSHDYACPGGAPTGQLTATAIGGFDGDAIQANFDISWRLKSSGAAMSAGAVASNLASDMYTLQVIDINGRDVGCSTSRDYAVTAARHLIDITASAQDQTICIPDGSAQIETITVDGGNIALPNAGWNVIFLDENRNDITPGLPSTGFSTNPFIDIAAGSYFVRTQDDATKCYSNPYQVIIEDISENPVISIDITSPQYSLNPDPTTWTGSMQATVTELATGIADPFGYMYAWHVGPDDVLAPISSIDNVSAVDEGIHTFIVTSNSTGCESRYQQYMPYVYLEPLFNTYIKPQTICSPYDGLIEVTDITLDGVPDLLSDYTFEWYHDTYLSGDVPDAIIPGNDVRTAYDNISAGSYYIIARENNWMIDSYPMKVEVIDSTTNPILAFNATLYHPLTSCDESKIANGSLAVDVYEDNTNPHIPIVSDYTYTWHTGSEIDPVNTIFGETNNSISGLPSGQYSVLVVNTSNNCRSENTYTIENESVIPEVAVSPVPSSNCPVEIANGIVSANVINSANAHIYNWYTGTIPSGSPAYTGATWKGRPVGFYTVVAIDEELETCISEPVIVMVEDATKDPLVLINEVAPVTNCDPARANGVLKALTQDGILGHTFEWYLNDTLVTTGPTASNLGLYSYQLVVTDDVTQCATAMESGPSALLGTVPPPDVDILTDRTSCLNPDGMATASVLGNITDYIFRYYQESTGNQLTNSYIDNIIHDLDTSSYFVTAEDRNTGCISDPTGFTISNETYIPEIEVIVDPSNCREPSGAANVIISDLTREYTVTWYGENGFESQMKEILYIPAGTYRVEVEGTDGCFTPPLDAEVNIDLLIFNGVSANFDGLNDFFKVACIEHFPDNNVKIYTRSGLLVYEQDFYDMNDATRRFVGLSNKGINLIGSELPIGTYYYVADKNDGTKPKIGYLELVR